MNRLELIEKLRQLDEVTLLELLDINSEELVDAFTEKIHERIEFIHQQIED